MSLSPVLLRHALLLSAVSLLSACDGASSVEDSALVIEGNTMGTFYRVSLAGVDKNREAALRGQIEAQLKEDDHQLSTYKDDSVRETRSSSPTATTSPESSTRTGTAST